MIIFLESIIIDKFFFFCYILTQIFCYKAVLFQWICLFILKSILLSLQKAIVFQWLWLCYSYFYIYIFIVSRYFHKYTTIWKIKLNHFFWRKKFKSNWPVLSQYKFKIFFSTLKRVNCLIFGLKWQEKCKI